MKEDNLMVDNTLWMSLDLQLVSTRVACGACRRGQWDTTIWGLKDCPNVVFTSRRP